MRESRGNSSLRTFIGASNGSLSPAILFSIAFFKGKWHKVPQLVSKYIWEIRSIENEKKKKKKKKKDLPRGGNGKTVPKFPQKSSRKKKK